MRKLDNGIFVYETWEEVIERGKEITTEIMNDSRIIRTITLPVILITEYYNTNEEYDFDTHNYKTCRFPTHYHATCDYIRFGRDSSTGLHQLDYPRVYNGRGYRDYYTSLWVIPENGNLVTTFNTLIDNFHISDIDIRF